MKKKPKKAKNKPDNYVTTRACTGFLLIGGVFAGLIIGGLGGFILYTHSHLSGQTGKMTLIVGLGNPGDKYAKNRHNIGFMAVDEIAERYNFPPFRAKFQGALSEGRIGGQKLALLKPETYMNNSGQSVKAAAKFFKIEPSQIIVFHDELDLQPGKMRVKHGGGNAGHNGLKSIQAHLGTPDFIRVRLGIGHPGDKSRVHGYVLKDFNKADHDWLDCLLPALAEHVDLLLSGQDGDYMSKVAMSCPSST